ncbi:MAG: hypothetical protein WAQ52_07870 [Terriglobales bacterium]
MRLVRSLASGRFYGVADYATRLGFFLSAASSFSSSPPASFACALICLASLVSFSSVCFFFFERFGQQ